MDGKDHIVTGYDEELSRLENLVAEMGGLAETQLSEAVDALVTMNAAKARAIIDGDAKIDAIETEISNFTVQLLVKRQPMAEDLRLIIATLKVSHNLERIGDYAKNIAKRTLTLQGEPRIESTSTIRRMSAIVQGMIKNVLDAFVARDAERANDVRLRDQEVDHTYASLFRELLTYMMEDPRNITPCTHLLFVAKNLERVGDHVTGVAEQVHFLVQGEMPPEERPKGDGSVYRSAK